MKPGTLSRCRSAGRRAVPRCVAALGAWALVTAFVSAADFTWKFGPGVDVRKLAYGDGLDSAPGNAFYNGSMYFFEDRVVVTGARSDRAAGCQVDVDAFEYVHGATGAVSKER